jgi:holo-[acyl-carrier protein] synthase
MHILGTGTHIVECLRIAQLIERYGELFIARVYTPYEINYCSARQAATQHYAAHWAAKEAILNTVDGSVRRRIVVRDLEIRAAPGGAATVVIRGAARDVLNQLRIRKLHVSLSHCRTHAVAYVIAEGSEG